ncbi:hypothetical protein BDV96DRAFT_596227 [Lophiotrema nucula]|uniref:NAD-dependent epimerase/dehydratase domain-containing protein n=1 Tax=Lophiotrema nucula TaxID=690887 RepID=A0A6A5ZJQ2_9PLEO|nr:hypothetical protein BDV96DRAFT_596227 [Lophiotrema nucula]
MAPQIQDPALPPDSLILVTGANGLIASHIVDQLLLYGYAVRGTVRSHARTSWMTPLYESRHPNSKLEIVEVVDITAEGCYDAALKGVSAVIHTAAINILSDDPSVITQSVDANLNVLRNVEKANKSGEKIERVVFTSSSWAVQYPQPNTPITLTYDTYNDLALKMLSDQNTPKEARGILTYVAGKVEAEKESWKWIASHKDAGFIVNTVIPGTCIGPVLAPEDQSYPTTAGYVRSVYEGTQQEVFQWLDPQWYVDVRDAARLHVAAVALAGVEGERVFALAETYTWPGVQKVIEEEMGKKCPVEMKEKGEDLSTVPLEKSTAYLKRLGLEGWEKFERSVRANIRSFYPRE